MLKVQKYGLFINGEFVDAANREVLEVYNPATGEQLAEVSKGSGTDVEKAVTAATEAQVTFKEKSITERAALLADIAYVIHDNINQLARIESLDSGKPIKETVEDILAIADQFDYFAGVVRVETDECLSHDLENITMIMKEPYGVVAQIIPWNFPFLLAGWKLAPALAAGNCVVIKPAAETPLSLLELARLTKDIIPPGVLNVVPGAGSVVGQAMISDERISKVAFTGSTPVGRSIGQAAAKLLVPATLELGGKSANIIFADAPMEKAIEGAALAILYGQGQVCNAGSRLFVEASVYEEVVEKLAKIFKKVRVGNPIERETRMGTLINQKQLDTVLSYIETGLEEGARLVCGGKRITRPPFDKGYFMEPTLFADVSNKMRIAREEIFGPVLVVIPFKTEEEAIEMANDNDFGLAGACWTKDINRALRVAKKIDTGLFWINEYHLAPSGTPFGGIKKSGYGRENHKSALEAYSRLKTIYISMSEEARGYYS
ncbi:aldehyde dehydrogenase family protein [Eubacteriaceae bacterium ES3]|nr:aldehyde dehydrogenase family protein [Eubacteriaceae bacterium ES3]